MNNVIRAMCSSISQRGTHFDFYVEAAMEEDGVLIVSTYLTQRGLLAQEGTKQTVKIPFSVTGELQLGRNLDEVLLAPNEKKGFRAVRSLFKSAAQNGVRVQLVRRHPVSDETVMADITISVIIDQGEASVSFSPEQRTYPGGPWYIMVHLAPLQKK